jgi:hypothetical protein
VSKRWKHRAHLYVGPSDLGPAMLLLLARWTAASSHWGQALTSLGLSLLVLSPRLRPCSSCIVGRRRGLSDMVVSFCPYHSRDIIR